MRFVVVPKTVAVDRSGSRVKECRPVSGMREMVTDPHPYVAHTWAPCEQPDAHASNDICENYRANRVELQ